MKAIKIDVKNAAAIESALSAENGSAREHTYTSYAEVEGLAAAAEQALENLRLLKAERIGAAYESTSGEKVANSYDWQRAATRVKLERRSTGWFLVSVIRTKVGSQGGKATLYLTAAQDAEAKRRFGSQYQVLA